MTACMFTHAITLKSRIYLLGVIVFFDRYIGIVIPYWSRDVEFKSSLLYRSRSSEGLQGPSKVTVYKRESPCDIAGDWCSLDRCERLIRRESSTAGLHGCGRPCLLPCRLICRGVSCCGAALS